MSRWYRAYEGTVTDPKLGEVALVAGCSRSVAIATWHAILEDCAAVNDGGRFETTPRRVAVILGEPLATIEAVFAELAALGMIADGAASAWSRCQFGGDTSTERSRKHRAAKRNVALDVCNGDATLHDRCATSTQRDTPSPPLSPPPLPPEPPIPTPPIIPPAPVVLGSPAREGSENCGDLRQAIVTAFSEVQSPIIPDTSRAGVWIAKGYEPAICLATIREGLARKPGIRSLAYFEPAIAEAHAPAAARAPPAGRPPNRPLTMIDGLIAHDARQAARTDR